jgi:hypothetical protein
LIYPPELEVKETTDNWKNKLSNILKDYSPDQIYYADETWLFFRLLPDKTFEFQDVKCHGGRQSKVYVILWRTLNLSSQPDEQSNSFSEIPNLVAKYRA